MVPELSFEKGIFTKVADANCEPEEPLYLQAKKVREKVQSMVGTGQPSGAVISDLLKAKSAVFSTSE